MSTPPNSLDRSGVKVARSDGVAAWRERRNVLKKRMVAGERPRVVWVSIPWPPIIEILAQAGVDGVLIDMQHSSLDLDGVERLIAASEAAGVSCLVRPRVIARNTISTLLDLGANGIVFPDIRTVDDAYAAREMMFYPPVGIRDWGGSHTRAVKWQGQSASETIATASSAESVYSEEFVKKANSELLMIFLVGTSVGLDNIQGILTAGSPDAVAFALGQFSVESSFDLAAAEKAALYLYDVCKERGVGFALSGKARAGQEAYPGCYIVSGIDILMIRKALHEALGTAVGSVDS